jgi:hypothetical protein
MAVVDAGRLNKMKLVKLVMTANDLDYLSDCDDVVHDFLKNDYGDLQRVELTFKASALERIREELSELHTGWRDVSVSETTLADTVIVSLRHRRGAAAG